VIETEHVAELVGDDRVEAARSRLDAFERPSTVDAVDLDVCLAKIGVEPARFFVRVETRERDPFLVITIVRVTR
jgi:hypothetical protein